MEPFAPWYVCDCGSNKIPVICFDANYNKELKGKIYTELIVGMMFIINI